MDEKTPKLNHTIAEVLAHDLVDLTLYLNILKDVVVGMILFQIEIIFHGDINPQSILKCGSSWKLTDLQSSQKYLLQLVIKRYKMRDIVLQKWLLLY